MTHTITYFQNESAEAALDESETTVIFSLQSELLAQVLGEDGLNDIEAATLSPGFIPGLSCGDASVTESDNGPPEEPTKCTHHLAQGNNRFCKSHSIRHLPISVMASTTPPPCTNALS
jgi:hypothetical protein